jgi:hypothetical protein
MGFSDKRKDKADLTESKESWKLLHLMAINNGLFPLSALNKKVKTKRKKKKQELVSLLKKYFSINTDPIIHDKIKDEYKSKIKLSPDKLFEDQWRDRNIHKDTNNKSYLPDI